MKLFDLVQKEGQLHDRYYLTAPGPVYNNEKPDNSEYHIQLTVILYIIQ